jgi:hypothetical protein
MRQDGLPPGDTGDHSPLPPTSQRRHSVELLLCGHHYRVSRQALAAARARIENLPGKADAAAAALLQSSHEDHAGVTTGQIADTAG